MSRKWTKLLQEAHYQWQILPTHPLAFLTLSLAEECIVLNHGMIGELEGIHNEAILA
jgi:hypothetical protein